jgi:hypothetical protein
MVSELSSIPQHRCTLKTVEEELSVRDEEVGVLEEGSMPRVRVKDKLRSRELLNSG